MNLIIVESPTKAKTLSRFLGKEYSFAATKGHIMDLPKSGLGVDIENNFEPTYAPVEKSAPNVKEIVKLARHAKQIYIATDPDREGEAIASHVHEILTGKIDMSIVDSKKLKNGKTPKSPTSAKAPAGKQEKLKIKNENLSRITFHEITKHAVEEAIAHPRNVDTNLVNAQVARRVLDRLVGYKISPVLWKKVRRGLSAGRVQSVAVRLIVEREREIEAFKAVEYWEIGADLNAKKANAKKQSFIVSLIKIGEKKAEVHDAETAKKIVSDLEKSNYTVLDVKKREVKKSPYPPFTTSTMTQAAARLMGWSAKRTMSIAQKLYEDGLITYHRTDSTYLNDAAVMKAREYIGTEFGKMYVPEKPRFFKTRSKVAQEAHEAIRPTEVGRGIKSLELGGGLDGSHAKLYELIWKRFLACQMTEARYDETTIDVKATYQLSANSYQLRASGQIMKFDGWRKLFPTTAHSLPTTAKKAVDSSQNAEGIVQELPAVEKEENLDLIKVFSEQKFTQPPPRFNEASLIKTLEKLGIGRPSTYAPTISTIQARTYVEKTEGKFKPTAVGMAVSDFLLGAFPHIVDYGFTAEMEDDLDNVANGKTDWQKMMKDFWNPLSTKITEVEKNSPRVKIATEKTGNPCPKCKEGEEVIRTGRFGKFLSCSRFPDCDYTGRYTIKIDMKCPQCVDDGKNLKEQGDVVVKKTTKGRIFYGCSNYPNCKWASWKNPMKPKKGEESNDEQIEI